MYHHTACCISGADPSGCHVSLIRLSLADLAASTELRHAAQQEHHSPPTNPAFLPRSPVDSLVLWLLATHMGLNSMKMKCSIGLGGEKSSHNYRIEISWNHSLLINCVVESDDIIYCGLCTVKKSWLVIVAAQEFSDKRLGLATNVLVQFDFFYIWISINSFTDVYVAPNFFLSI